MTNFSDQNNREGPPFSAVDDELKLELDMPPQKSLADRRPGTLYEGLEPASSPPEDGSVPPEAKARSQGRKVGLHPPVVRQPAAYSPTRTAQDRGSLLMKLFFLGLLGIGAYGGYYGFCTYETSTKVNAFSREVQNLRQLLVNKAITVRPEHVKTIILELAQQTGVQINADQIQVTIEPLTAANRTKLNTLAQTAIGIAAKISRHRTPRWLVGFTASGIATCGIAKQTFEASQYVWSDDARP